MSPRTRRQELRQTAGHGVKPYSQPSSKSNCRTTRKPDSTYPSGEIPPAVLASDSANPEVTQARNLGMPSRAQYKYIEEEYIASLHPRKQEKALLSQDLFDKVWDVLHDPGSPRVGTPQFRWWVRKMFILSYPKGTLSPAELESLGVENSTAVVLHDNRPVALKDQIYDVLCYCHQIANHGGRDKTTAIIREHYSWIPKELIAQFVKACPTCVFKKTGKMDLALSMNNQDEFHHSDLVKREMTLIAQDQHMSALPPPSQCVSLPVTNLIGGKPHAPGALLKGWTQPEPYLVSSEIPHPMPPMQSWSTGSYQSGSGSWSSAPSVYGSNASWSSGSPPHAGSSNAAYQMPPMQRAHSAEEVYRNAVGHPNKNARVTLPPLMKSLSEGMGMQPPMMRPLYGTTDRDDYGMPPIDTSYQTWMHPMNDSGNLGHQDQYEAPTSDVSYVPQIDPTLLAQDGQAELPDDNGSLLYPDATSDVGDDGIPPPYSVSPTPSPSPESRGGLKRTEMQLVGPNCLATPPRFSRKNLAKIASPSPRAPLGTIPCLTDISPAASFGMTGPDTMSDDDSLPSSGRHGTVLEEKENIPSRPLPVSV